MDIPRRMRVQAKANLLLRGMLIVALSLDGVKPWSVLPLAQTHSGKVCLDKGTYSRAVAAEALHFGVRRTHPAAHSSSLFISGSSDVVDDGGSSCVVSRLDLTDRFSRWRFLQQLLEAEVDAMDVNEILYRTLKSFLDYPRPERIEDDTSPSGTRENPAPKVTPRTRAIMDAIFRADETTGGVGCVMALREPECTPFEKEALAGITQLLPDPVEEEEAHKSGWDLVMELVGREAVKMNEQGGSEGWRARCDIARMLIHYDFLNDGVVEKPYN